MSPHGRRILAWSFASCFALVQVVVSVQAVAHAMQHVQHEATPHAPTGCMWLHVAGESLETANDSTPSRFVFVVSVDVPVHRAIGVLLPLSSCSRAPPFGFPV